MKRLSQCLYAVLIVLLACEKDDPMVQIKTDGKPSVITNTTAELTRNISGDNLQDQFTVRWNKTDYGVDTEVSYTVEVDLACNSFQAPVTVGSTNQNSYTVTLDALNTGLLSGLKLGQHVPADLQVRVTSQIKNQFVKTSDPVTFTVTPWSAWSKGLWLLSDGWNDADAPAIYALDDNNFEGYVYLDGAHAFTLADNRTCGKTEYGGSDGQLSGDATSTKLSVPSSGYYRIEANVKDKTYTITPIQTFGLIGTATPGGWNTSSAMTYNADAQVWESTIDLVSGALKFRANNEWTINYGPADATAFNGTLVFNDPGAITISEPGNYTVTADFSRTKSPGITYTIRKNASGELPAQLWVPGEYQGWNPGAAPTIKAVNASTFEGFVYISAATGYKFTSAPDWDHINYGDAGNGTLTTDGLGPSLGLPQAGYYRFIVNVNALTYKADLINSMGLVGPATTDGTDSGWNQSVPMTYDQQHGVWKATVNLVPGAVKFRANNEWTINYGPADSNSLSGTLISDDPGAIDIKEAGSYTVTADFSRSASPYKYTYSMVKN